MTTSRDSDRGDGAAPIGDRLRLDHLRVGLPLASQGSGVPEPSSWDLNEILAPFVAWLATQELDESARRRHREAVERFLRWSQTDDGPVRGRRRRYEQYVAGHDRDHLDDATTGLDWWMDHRQLVARTLPFDR